MFHCIQLTMNLRFYFHYHPYLSCGILSFISGVAVETVMVKLHVGEVNFYKVVKAKRSKEIAEYQFQQTYCLEE